MHIYVYINARKNTIVKSIHNSINLQICIKKNTHTNMNQHINGSIAINMNIHDAFKI